MRLTRIINRFFYKTQSYPIYLLFFYAFFTVFVSCQKEPSDKYISSDVDALMVDSYEKFDLKEDELGLPVKVKYDRDTKHLLVFDLAQQKVLEINSNGEIAVAYGGEGRGPGELQGVENFYITEDYLYIVDSSLYLINKYDRKGNFISSLDYGKLTLKKEYNGKLPPPPAIVDNNNEPFLTLSGKVLLPSHTQGQSLYQLIDWQGNHLADIGEIPQDFDPSIDDQAIRSALENREVPARDLHSAFPINDRTNPSELYLIYSAIPKIVKYDLSGEKLWESKIPLTPEIDSLAVDLYNVIMERSDYLLPARKYISGTSNSSGELYLATYTSQFAPVSNRPIWLHQISPNGKLVQRYKIITDTDLSYNLDIDFNSNRIFIPLSNGTGIRLYSF